MYLMENTRELERIIDDIERHSDVRSSLFTSRRIDDEPGAVGHAEAEAEAGMGAPPTARAQTREGRVREDEGGSKRTRRVE